MSGWTDVADWERQRSGVGCQACLSKPDALAQLEASWVLIGPDDPIRGYACLVVSRHAIELHDLTEAEGTALMRDIRKVSAAIARIMSPVKMNYEVHGNTAPHLQWARVEVVAGQVNRVVVVATGEEVPATERVYFRTVEQLPGQRQFRFEAQHSRCGGHLLLAERWADSLRSHSQCGAA